MPDQWDDVRPRLARTVDAVISGIRRGQRMTVAGRAGATNIAKSRHER
jgi:hypothetical protein